MSRGRVIHEVDWTGKTHEFSSNLHNADKQNSTRGEFRRTPHSVAGFGDGDTQWALKVVELANPDFLTAEDAFKSREGLYKFIPCSRKLYLRAFCRHAQCNRTGFDRTGWPDFSATMYVSDEYTLNSSGSKISSDTYTRIGAYAKSRLDTYLDKGDAYVSMFWDGNYSTPGTIDAILRWDMALPGTPLGFTLTYAGSQNVSNRTNRSFDNSGTYKYRQVGLDWDQYKYLQSVDQNFTATFAVGLFDPNYSSSVKTWATKWTYDISSTQSFSFGGTQTVPVYITYGN